MKSIEEIVKAMKELGIQSIEITEDGYKVTEETKPELNKEEAKKLTVFFTAKIAPDGNVLVMESNSRYVKVSPTGEVLNTTSITDEKLIAACVMKAMEKLEKEAANKQTINERVTKERKWDETYNEGCEGYNPYREGSRPTYWKSRW